MPNGPSTMEEPPPTKKNTVDEATILKTLPDMETIANGMATVYVLSTQACDSVSGHNVMVLDMNENEFLYKTLFKTITKKEIRK